METVSTLTTPNPEIKDYSEPPKLANMEQYRDGINLDSLTPKPFDIDLQECYSSTELNQILEGKTPQEKNELIKKNRELLFHNNAEIQRLNDRVIDLSELSSQELEAVYNDSNTSDSDKSIIACIGGIRFAIAPNTPHTPEEDELFANIESITKDLYGFGIVKARDILAREGSHYRILTKKEREAVGPGSLEDIASAALEAFIMNPNMSNSRILDYEDYLYGIQLDCTKRQVVKRHGETVIEEKLDLDEFQDRVIESQSSALLDSTSTDEDRDKLKKGGTMELESATMYADYITGHHYITDEEEKSDAANRGSELFELREQNESNADGPVLNEFWARFTERVRDNNKEVFEYDKKIAKAEIKPWVKKLNFEQINNINNDKSLDYRKKLEGIISSIQSSLEIGNSQSLPISVKLAYTKNEKGEAVSIRDKKRIQVSPQSEDICESEDANWRAYYSESKRCIFFAMPASLDKKLSVKDIGILIHEMWHAKQYDETGFINPGLRSPAITVKKRLYEKNEAGYIFPGEGYDRYTQQIMEMEALTIEEEFKKGFKKYHRQRIGKQAIKAILGK